ncbi:MAG: heparinase II/III family protein [bacterium]|nr:heparinase II/III family protein [bacterium]
MVRLIYGWLFGLVCLVPLCAQPAIVPVHPRIYVTPERVPELRRLCQTVYRDLYQEMRGMNWVLDREPGAGHSDMTNMVLPAFLYLVEGEEALANSAKNYLEAVAKNPPKEQYLTPEMIRHTCIVFDWIYDRLAAEEKARYARALVEMGEYMLTLWRHSDFNNHFVNEHLSVLYIGVLLHGEGMEEEAVARFLEEGMDYLKNHGVPAANEIAGQDGGQAEGFSYNDWGYARPLTHTTELWRVAGGEDLFASSPFFATQGVWHLYCRRPHDGAFVKAEDCPSGFKPGEDLKSYLSLIAARTGDGYAQWLSDQIPWRYKQKAWQEILWRDPQLQAEEPNSLPLAKHFKKLGWVATRSGWDAADDTFALFQCGDFYAGHQHLDANAFVIHKGGSLAIDSGVNEYSRHRANYYARTIAHNSVVVWDPTERFSSAVWVGDDTEGANDGGQLRPDIISRVGVFEEGGPRDTATITQYEASPHFTYVCGDATKSYSPRKLRFYTRQFVHLQPDLFVVFDRVDSPAPGFDKAWLLHSIEEPIQEGEGWAIEQNQGRLVVHTLLPEASETKIIGGPGKEFWVDGTNYPPDSKSDPESGAWRLEVHPRQPETETQFFHVLQVGLEEDWQPVAFTRLSEENRQGIRVEYQGKTATLFFATQGEPALHLTIQAGSDMLEQRQIPARQTGIVEPIGNRG